MPAVRAPGARPRSRPRSWPCANSAAPANVPPTPAIGIGPRVAAHQAADAREHRVKYSRYAPPRAPPGMENSRIAARPPGRSARCISRSAAAGSPTLRMPNATVAASRTPERRAAAPRRPRPCAPGPSIPRRRSLAAPRMSISVERSISPRRCARGRGTGTRGAGRPSPSTGRGPGRRRPRRRCTRRRQRTSIPADSTAVQQVVAGRDAVEHRAHGRLLRGAGGGRAPRGGDPRGERDPEVTARSPSRSW